MLPILRGALVCAGLCAAVADGSATAQDRPNIIFIMADDLGYGDLGVLGQEDILTPSIDLLAEEGRLFTQAYAPNPICAPSRCSVLTGLHVGHCSIDRNGNVNLPLRVEDITVAEVLKGAGYTSGVFGKWAQGGELPESEGFGEVNVHSTPLTKGFDRSLVYRDQALAWFYYADWLWEDGELVEIEANAGGAEEVYTHDLFADAALAFIEEHATDPEPFFLYLPYTIPHAKVQIPDQGTYAGEDWPEIEKNFAAMITYMDTDIGEMVDLLEDLGIAEQTLVLFTSDNGPHESETDGDIHDAEFFGSAGGLRGHKHDLYEGGIRVPLIAHWPGTVPEGTTSDTMVSLHDLLPTAAELATVAAPSGLDGISLVPALTDEGELEERDHLFWEHNGDFSGAGEPLLRYAVRREDWKYVRLHLGEEQLYDLAVDEGETTDVAADYPDVVEELAAIANSQAGDPPWPTAPRIVASGDVVATGELPDEDPTHTPVLYMRFDNDDGDAGDIVSQALDDAGDPAHHGEGMGGASYTSDVFGDTVPFDGNGNAISLELDLEGPQYLTVPHHQALCMASSGFTIEAWVRLDELAQGTSSGDRRWLVVKKDGGTDDQTVDYGFLVQAGAVVLSSNIYGKAQGHTGHELAMMFGNDNYSLDYIWVVISSLEITDSDWHYVSVAYDAPGGMMRFVLDGESEEIEFLDHGHWHATGDLVVGAHPNPTGSVANGFGGALDELRISRGAVPMDQLLTSTTGSEPEPPPVYTLDFGELQLGDGPVEATFSLANAAEAYSHLLVGEVSDDEIDDPRLSIETGTFGPMADGGTTGEYVVTLDPSSAGVLDGQRVLVNARAYVYETHAMGSPLVIEITGEVIDPSDDDDSTGPDDDDTTPTDDDDDDCECRGDGGGSRGALIALVLLGVGVWRRRG